MNQVRPTLYSAPRRFDLATILAVTSAYALLFAGLARLQSPPATTLIIAGFITLVGVAQSVLFGGNRPRLASAVAGVGMSVVPFLIAAAMGRPSRISVGCQLIAGPLMGYLAGALVGSVFLVSDYLRRFIRRTFGIR